MWFNLSNIFTVIVSVLTLFGLTIHDTQTDRALIHAAAPVPVTRLTESIEKLASEVHEHAHTESSSFSTVNIHNQQPSTQPRNEDEKKYVTQKRQKYSFAGSEYIWPSR
ncbi:hypothetical protein HGB24_03240 [Candidatus Saccharibacteria bacterium]|nr:hypothetical protein [Candidatus Saccharibacteria bacterium]